MANGGARPGAGRKKGKALVLRDLLKKKDIDGFLSYLLANYKKDTRLATWMGDHIFGKAPQSMDITSGGEKLPTPILASISNGLPSNDSPTKDTGV